MPQTDLILLHAPSVYDFRKMPLLYGPVGDLVPSTSMFEMYPMGFLSIAEQLEMAGHRVRIVNLAYRMIKSNRFDAEAFIKKLDAPAFGIDLHWMVHAHGSIEIAKLVKKYHPESKVIFGGYMATYFYKELIARPEVDFIVRGDSTEESMKALMPALKSGRFDSIPNLVWKDIKGRVNENPFVPAPQNISDIMIKQYSGMMRQVLRYHDLSSAIPYKGWLSHPVTTVFTCRGCNHDCVLCGASRTALKSFANRQQPAFRTPEDTFKDIQNISRFSPSPIFLTGDIRESGKENAAHLLSLIQHKPVKNTLMFELFDTAPATFIEELQRAAPGFSLDISPQSHDEAVRKAQGRHYSNKELEISIETALKVGASRMDVFFLMGLPEQTVESALATIDYCEYLLRKFDGDKRLFLFTAVQSPFLAPGSLAFQDPERYGYKLRYKTLEEHRQALTRPSWKYTLNYETDWISRDQLVDVAYEVMTRLVRIKAKYGQIPQKVAEAQVAYFARGRETVSRIDEIVRSGNGDELAKLKPEMDSINNFRAVQHRQLDLPMGMLHPQNLLAVWNALTNK